MLSKAISSNSQVLKCKQVNKNNWHGENNSRINNNKGKL